MVIGIIFGNFIFYVAINWSPIENQLKVRNDSPSSESNFEKCTVVTENYLSASGNNVKTELYTNVSGIVSLKTPYYEEHGYKYFEVPINTQNHNISQTNLTFFNIEASTTVQTIEDNPEDYLDECSPGWHAMSIKISTPCKVRQLQLFVQELNQTAESPYWTVEIFNACRKFDFKWYIAPDKFTGISIDQRVIGTQAAHWHNFTFPEAQLNMSNTYIDPSGFAFYFFKITMPPKAADARYLYFSYDHVEVDDGWAYYGVGESELYITENDICMRVEVEPLNTKPQPSDILLGVKNVDRPFSDVTIEANHSVPVLTLDAVSLLSGKFRIPAQNFTLTDYGTIHNISLYLKCSGGLNSVLLGITPPNTTGIGPLWDGNSIYDVAEAINISDGFEGWYTFSMGERPNLKPGTYWWGLLYYGNYLEPGNNLTLYGSQDPPDKAQALNITITSFYDTRLIAYNYANIIGIQYGKDILNVTKSWISNEILIPDLSAYYHYTIVTRWLGITRLNVIYSIELQNITSVKSNYFSFFQSEEVLWNLSIQATFPLVSSGKSIHFIVPRDWNVKNITINGRSHNIANWTLYQQQGVRILSVHNCSNGRWTVWCNSTAYQVDFTIEKLIAGQFLPCVNGTVYDRFRINTTIANQTNGACDLRVLYPDNKTMFSNQTELAAKHTILSWYPENDTAASGGKYVFVVYWSNGTELGYNRRLLFLTSIPTNLTLVSLIPLPYVNDITKTLIIRYNDSRGGNILGATLSAKLSGIPLEWEDLYSKSLNPEDKGLYRIKLNTTGLNANQYYPLSISAQKEGYNNVSLAQRQVLVQSVPTSITTSFNNITQYGNQFISFSCSFKDTFHATGIDWASISYIIVGTNINGSMMNIMPGESVYIVNNLQLSNLIGRTAPYLINITANALNCEIKSAFIDLFVLNKTGTILEVFTPTGTFIQGQSMQIQAHLQNKSSLQGIPNATIRFYFGGVIPERIAMTDSNGIAVIEISIPEIDFSITAVFNEVSSTSGSFTTPLKINVLSYTDLALWIGIIAAVCVASIIAVRQLYFVPKRKVKMQRYQRIANKFQDVANLRQVLIIIKESGNCIFQQSFAAVIDGDLISGFLTAISAFETELKVKQVLQKEPKTGGFEINYQDYKILLFEGTLIRLAIVVEQTPSEEFRKLVQSLVGEYEERYGMYIKKFAGNLAPFDNSAQFITQKLEMSLIWPHKIRKPGPMEKFTALEQSVMKIADTIMKSQAMDYVFLPMVISVGQAGAPKSKLEIFATVYNLRFRDIFIPLDPNTTI